MTSDRNTMVYRNPYHGYSTDTEYNNNDPGPKGYGQYNGHYTGGHGEDWAGHHHHTSNGYTTQVGWQHGQCSYQCHLSEQRDKIISEHSRVIIVMAMTLKLEH